MKICFKCQIEKSLDEFYKHPQMPDGHLNKCKSCTKKDVKNREEKLKLNDDYIEKERKRGREKYHKYKYKTKNTSAPCQKYRKDFPEKYKAQIKSAKIEVLLGNRHHWSYNEEHYLDIIDISFKDHKKAHRFIIYDRERMMYRRIDNNELLDTKEKHLEWIMWCIKNKEN
jgi:hypothetical protein